MAEICFRIPSLRPMNRYGESECAQELRRLLPLAEQWDASAQFRVGQILGAGLGGVPVDLLEAAKWTDLAARTSDHAACTALQVMIDTHGWEIVGEGKRRAFRWQQELYNAEDGWPPEAPAAVLSILKDAVPKGLCFLLGADLTEGKNFPIDYEKAFRCFLFGAERDGCVHCTFNVGHAYYCGKGVKADPVRAIDWLKIASGRGYAKAAFQLAIMALRGHGMAPDKGAARSFCREAERLGHADAGKMIEAINAGAKFY